MDRQPQPYQFHFRNVRLFKTDSLGTGSYGAVCKAMCDLLPCAAKLLHPILFQNSGPGVRSPRSRFEQECHFLNAMKHPNIVQYLGTTQDPDSGLPVLLMELMDESLTRFLERSQQPLPYHVEVTLCHDIALALDYLHSNDVIHRDLSSNNVLLIAGSRAKVTDFGMSKLLSVNPRLTPYTTCPGTLVYMPPEALRDPPVYSNKIDSFSFGVIEIQILTCQFPEPGPASEMVEDPRYRVGRIQVPIPDSERRKSHIDLIDPAHPLLPMALHCINYSEEERPSAENLCREIALLREAPRYARSLEQARQRGGAAQGSERRLREENAQLSQQNRELQSQVDATTLEMVTTTQDLQATTQELRATSQELQQNIATLTDSQRDNQQLRQELLTKDGILEARQSENQQLRQELLNKEESLVAKQRENEQLQHTVQDKDIQLRANEQVTAEFQQNLIQREQTIRGLEETINRLGQGPEEPVKEKQHVAEAKQMPLQQPKQKPQTTAKSQNHPKQESSLPTPPRGMQRGATAADGHATGQHQITIRDVQWQKAKDTPESMYRGVAVSHGNIVYFNGYNSTSVYYYESQQQLWRQLPDCHSRDAALVMVAGRLTTIGGKNPRSRPTKSLVSLTGEGEDYKWAELFPRMPTARYSLAAVCSGRNVIAAGGLGRSGRILRNVEILNTELRQWTSAASLPHPIFWASITVCKDLLYLLGGFDQNGRQSLSVLTSSITDLLHHQQKAANQSVVWHQAADTPYYESTAVSVGGQLLAIGGQNEHGKNTSAIVAYDPTSASWQHLGHMATPRYWPLVAVLPSNQLIVAGGLGGQRKVEIGTVV